VAEEMRDEEDKRVEAFCTAPASTAARMGGVNVLSAAAACRETFGPPAKMTPWQRRAVNQALLTYGVYLDFPDAE
jgi:hypothetical protein